MTQIVLGLVSFWLSGEYTYGSVESYDYKNEPLRENDLKAMFAMKSREHVLNHEKYQEMFSKYAEAIGIDKEQSYPEWDVIKEKLQKIEEDKIKAEVNKKIEQEKAIKKAEEENLYNLIHNRQNIIDAYFKKLRAKNLTRFVGNNHKLHKV